jgi:hypothetical protein
MANKPLFTPEGLSVGNLFNPSNVISANADITAGNAVSANYFLGNGALLSGITANYSNANVAAYLASNSNITLTLGTGNITTQGNVSVGNLVGSGDNVDVKAGVYTWQFNNTGNLVLPANSFSINYANGTQVALGGTYSNSNVADYLASNANIPISIGVSNITTQGNITGNYFIGNGALLTGVVTSSYSNANVANYLPTYTGNLGAGNLNLTGNIVDTGALSLITGSNSNITLAPGNTNVLITTTTGVNIAGYLNTSGNITVGNLIGSGNNVDIRAGSYNWRFDDTGNFTLPGNATAIYYANGTQVPVGYGNANVAAYLPNYQGLVSNIDFRSTSPAAVAMVVTDRPLTIGGNTYSYITLPNDGNANSVATELTNHGLGNVLISSGPDDHEWVFDNSGNLTAPGNITAGNAIAANYFIGNGAFLTGITAGSSYSNANVANYLPTYNGNATFGNVSVSRDMVITGNLRVEGNTTYINVEDLVIDDYRVIIGNAATQLSDLNGAGLQIGNLANSNIQFLYNSTSNVMTLNYGANISNVLNVAGNITATGNVSVGNLVGTDNNVEIAAGSYAWQFNNTGNLVLPANSFSINYANGTQVALGGTYSNSNVADYLASNANITILTQGNISGNYFIGNGALLTGVVTSSYSNANVANYLPTYTGNLGAGNLNLTGNIIDTGALSISTGGNGNITLAPGNTNVLIATPNGVNVVGYLSTSGNISTGNLVGTSDNVEIAAGSYVWQFNNTGNLVLPANSFSINYANGTQVALGGSSSYSNANVANYLPTYTGNITAGNIDVTGNVTANWFVGNVNTTNSLVTSGNVTANNFIGSAANTSIVANIYTWTFNESGNLVLPSNAFSVNYANGAQVSLGGSYSNADVANYLASNANLTVTVGIGNITTQGNISGNYFIGNGALLTGVVTSSYSNANVANYLPTYTGNITAGNIAVTGNVTANWFVGNVNTTNSLVTSGNVTANNFIGSEANTSIVANIYTWTFNDTGNLVLPGNSFAVNYANGAQVSLGGSYSNADVANYLPTYNGNATFGNLTVSRDTVILGNLRVEGNTTYINVEDLVIDDYRVIIGNAATQLSDLNGAGLQIGNLANSNIQFLYNSTSNAMTLNYGANIANVLNVAGNVNASGNVQGSYILGNGALLTGISAGYSNANVANYLPTYTGNVSAGNLNLTGNIVDTGALQIITGASGNIALAVGNSNVLVASANGVNVIGYLTATGDISTQGNISVGSIQGANANTTIVANVYSWTFDDTGNFTLPGNTTAIYFANGTQVPIGYDNASVANYLGSNANVTVALGTGNITTQGNVSGNYFIGNGALLTGLSAGYSNTNVKSYLSSFDGNILPSANVTYDLGSNSNRWNDLYLNNSTIYIGAQEITANATSTIFSGNISANYILGNGTLLSGMYSNADVANYLPTYTGNLAAGNITANAVTGSSSNVRIGNISNNVYWTFDSAGNLTLPANAFSVNYANGTQVALGGSGTSYSNANVANYLPTYTGNITAGNITATGNVSAGNFSGSGTNVVIRAGTYAWTFGNEGNLTSNGNIVINNGNITGNYFIGNGALLTGVVTSSYSNANVANYLPTYTGNITAGNITATGNVTANAVNANLVKGSNTNVRISASTYTWTFNDSGNLVLPANAFSINYANGTQVALGGDTSYSNANVANYLPTYTGNVGAGNVAVTGNVTANWFVGNINATNTITTTGNITANNFIGNGINTNITAGNYTWSFNETGNLVLPANAFSINYANGTQVALGGGTSYSNANVANYLPTYTGNVGAGNVVGSGNGVQLKSNGYTWTFDSTGNFVLPSNAFSVNYANGTQVALGGGTSYSNANVANYLASNAAVTILTTSNITTSANIAAGNASITYNITAGNYLGTGSNTILEAGSYSWTFNDSGNLILPANSFSINYANGTQVTLGGSGTSYSNADVANYLPIYNGNALFGNANVTGNLTVAGNFTSGNILGTVTNVTLVAGSYGWTFNDQGNIVLASNTFAVNYANGQQVSISGTYSNTNVAAYLASNASVTILTQGNITGNYFIGNGALLTGVVTDSYSNANVANYMPTYNGNALFANVTVSRDLVVLGNFRVEGNTTEVNVSNLFIEDKDLIIAANANATLGDLNGAGIQIGNRTAGGNITFFYDSTSNVMNLSHGANIANRLVVNGNISASNFLGNGINTNVVSGSYTWQFNDQGNLTLPSNSFSINYANGTQVSLGGGTSYSNSNVLSYLSVFPGNIIPNANITYNLGNADYRWNDLYLANSTIYIGNARISANATALIMTNPQGAQTIFTGTTGNISAGNFIGTDPNTAVVSGSYSWTFDNTGNLVLPANSFSINYANGTQVTLGGSGTSYSNADVANYLPTYTGNITAGNVTATANVSANNVVANNIVANSATGSNANVRLISDTYIWTFNNTGNLVLPANSFSINYANGTQVALGGTYSNANVANYLPTYTGNISANNVLANNISANAVNGSNVNVRLIADTYTWTFNSSGNLVLPANSFSVNYANGAQVSLGGTYSNADVANYLPTYTGNVGAGNVNLTGNIIDTGALQIVTGANGNISLAPNNSNVLITTTTGVNVVGYLNTTGNITGGNLIGSGSNVDIGAGAYTWTFDSTGNFTLPGNTVFTASGNVTANNFISSDPNVSLIAGSYSWTFNDSGNLVLPANSFSINYANGTQVALGGIFSPYSNANVANYLPTYTGNLGAGNVNLTGNIIDTGPLQIITGASGNISLAPGNSNVLVVSTTGINVTGNISTTANISAGNVSGTAANLTVQAGSYSWVFNDTGNLVLPANSFSVNYANGTQVALGGSGTSYSNANVANYLPTYTGNVGAGNVNLTGNIIDTGALNISTGANGNISLMVNNSNVLIANANGVNVAGYLTTSGNLTAGNFVGSGINTSIVAGSYTWQFDNTGNLVLPANAFSVNYANGTQVALGGGTSYSNANVANYLPTYTGNISAGNYLGASNNVTISAGTYTWSLDNTGNLVLPANSFSINYANGTQVALGGSSSYSNANVANYLPTYTGNISAGNFLGSGINISVVAGSYTWSFNDLGNLVLPANSFSINYANGTQVALAGTYSNSNVAAYLASNSNVNILTTGNVTGNYILGNGSLLTGLPATYSNANVANYLPTYTGNLSAGNYTGSGINVSIAAGIYTWNFNDLGNFVLPGNSFSVNYANGTQVALGGSYSNSNVAAYLASNSNVNILTTGNVTGNYILGNGALLTGLPATYSNANVANYLPTYTGNLSAGNYTGSGINVSIAAGSYTWSFNDLGNLVLPANSFSINYANGTQVALAGSYSNSNVAAYLASNSNVNITTTGAITATGNITTTGAITATGNITTTANISAGNYLGASNNVTISAGTYTWSFDETGNLVLPANAFSVNYANGTQVALGGSGSSSYSNANVANYLPTYTGNLGAGNVNLTGNIVDTGAIFVITGANGNVVLAPNGTSRVIATTSGANVVGNLDVTGNLTAGNLSVANGNITLGNLVGSGTNVEIVSGAYTWTFDGAGNLTGTGNVSAGNFVGSAGNTSIVTNAYSWTFDSAGNLTLPANSFSINYANGTQVALGGTYSNSNVAAYLASNANVTITVGVSNITTQGNIAGNYFVGNGALLTGVVTSSYSNANVANYLPTYTGNVSAGNVNLTGNIVDTGAIFVITGANGNVVLAPNGTSRIIATTSGANIVGNIDVAGNVNANGATLTGNLTAGNLSVANGNITLGNLVGSGTNVEIVSGNYTWTFDGAGNLTGTGNVSAGNFVGAAGNTSIVTNAYSWTFNDSGNLVLPGNTFAINYANGAQVSLAGTYSNSNVADYLSSFTGNIGNGNTQDSSPIFNGAVYAELLTPLGGITTVDIGTAANPFAKIYTNDGFYANNGTGNFAVTVATGYDNVNGVKLQNFATAQWSNLFVGNVNAATGITTAGNATAGYFLGNGAFLTGIITNYSNANVAAYLPTYTGAIDALTGNVTTTANIQAAYFIGNGSQLTSIPTNYSNANVANYLPTYTGILTAGTTTINGNLIVAGNISATGNLTYINVQDLVIDDPLIQLAANNPGDTEDLGIVAGYYNAANLHTGFARDYTDKTWKVFEGVSTEPNTVINWSQAVFAPLKAGNITANGTITANANISGGNIVLSNFASINEGNIRGFSIGYRDVPQISWTGTPTLALTDAGKHYYNSAGGVTLTVPDDSSVNFPVGAAVTLINQSASNSTIVPSSGVSIYLAGNSTITVTANRTMTSNAFGTIVKVSANTWFLSGANIT